MNERNVHVGGQSTPHVDGDYVDAMEFQRIAIGEGRGGIWTQIMDDDVYLFPFVDCRAVVEVLFSLQEPWRERFMVWLANLSANTQAGWSGNAVWNNDHEPDQTEIFDWLKIHPSQCRKLKQMLKTWTKDTRL